MKVEVEIPVVEDVVCDCVTVGGCDKCRLIWLSTNDELEHTAAKRYNESRS